MYWSIAKDTTQNRKKLLQLHNPPQSAWEQLKEAIGSMGREYVIDTIFSNTPLGAIPMGDVEGVIGTIMAGQSEQQWCFHKFLN